MSNGTWRKGMTEAKAVCIGLFFLGAIRKISSSKKLSCRSPSFVISVPVFSLNARFVSEFILHKGVGDFIILVGVFSPAICVKKGVTDAPGKLILDG